MPCYRHTNHVFISVWMVSRLRMRTWHGMDKLHSILLYLFRYKRWLVYLADVVCACAVYSNCSASIRKCTISLLKISIDLMLTMWAGRLFPNRTDLWGKACLCMSLHGWHLWSLNWCEALDLNVLGYKTLPLVWLLTLLQLTAKLNS